MIFVTAMELEGEDIKMTPHLSMIVPTPDGLSVTDKEWNVSFHCVNWFLTVCQMCHAGYHGEQCELSRTVPEEMPNSTTSSSRSSLGTDYPNHLYCDRNHATCLV